jgi:hypothetical protein
MMRPGFGYNAVFGFVAGCHVLRGLCYAIYRPRTTGEAAGRRQSAACAAQRVLKPRLFIIRLPASTAGDILRQHRRIVDVMTSGDNFFFVFHVLVVPLHLVYLVRNNLVLFISGLRHIYSPGVSACVARE